MVSCDPLGPRVLAVIRCERSTPGVPSVKRNRFYEAVSFEKMVSLYGLCRPSNDLLYDLRNRPNYVKDLGNLIIGLR